MIKLDNQCRNKGQGEHESPPDIDSLCLEPGQQVCLQVRVTISMPLSRVIAECRGQPAALRGRRGDLAGICCRTLRGRRPARLRHSYLAPAFSRPRDCRRFRHWPPGRRRAVCGHRQRPRALQCARHSFRRVRPDRPPACEGTAQHVARRGSWPAWEFQLDQTSSPLSGK